MEDEVIRHRYYKISINIGPLMIYNNSRVYEIPVSRSTILPGLKYSLITILLGWWGFSLFKPFKRISNSLEALHVNFTGGEDISSLVSDLDYDEKTNYVWNNLLRKTTEKLRKDEVEIIGEIQEDYIDLKNEQFTEENIDYILINLSKIDIHRIRRDEIRDIFEAMKMFEKHKNKTKFA